MPMDASCVKANSSRTAIVVVEKVQVFAERSRMAHRVRNHQVT